MQCTFHADPIARPLFRLLIYCGAQRFVLTHYIDYIILAFQVEAVQKLFILRLHHRRECQFDSYTAQ